MAKRTKPAKKAAVKNPAAVALARLRAEKLSAERRREIGQKAIEARWAKHRSK